MKIKQNIIRVLIVLAMALIVNTVFICAFTMIGTVKTMLSSALATVFSDTYDIVTPAGSDSPTGADDRMRETKAAVQERMNVDHFWPLTGTEVSDPCTGEHRKILYTAPIPATPTVAASHGDTRIADVDGKAELHWTDEDEQEVQMTQVGEVCLGRSTAPRPVMHNETEEDGAGGRESRLIAKGEQSGAEVTTLGYIEFAHDGAADDEKGRFSIVVNDGDDADAPSKIAVRYLSPGTLDVGNSVSVLDEDAMGTDSATQLATQQSIKAYVDNSQIVVQVVNVMKATKVDCDTAMVLDNTIPQKTEGDECMTLAITPTSASNKLKIEVVANILVATGNRSAVVALFQDATANALAAVGYGNFLTNPQPVTFTHYMTAGTTNETTFKVRAGGISTNVDFNGTFFGGVSASSITITEIKV